MQQIIVRLHQDVPGMQKIVDGMQQNVVGKRLPDAYDAEDRCWDATERLPGAYDRCWGAAELLANRLLSSES